MIAIPAQDENAAIAAAATAQLIELNETAMHAITSMYAHSSGSEEEREEPPTAVAEIQGIKVKTEPSSSASTEPSKLMIAPYMTELQGVAPDGTPSQKMAILRVDKILEGAVVTDPTLLDANSSVDFARADGESKADLDGCPLEIA